MFKDRYLLVYHNGSRGDFLASILFGDVLETNTDGPLISQTGCKLDKRNVFKIHSIHAKVGWASSPVSEPLEPFENYTTIRIKLDSIEDRIHVTKLHFLKKPHNSHKFTVEAAFAFERHCRPYDKFFDYVIPFRDLFDINKIKSLFVVFRSRDMTDEEEQRVVDNISQNLKLITRVVKW